MVSQLVGQLNPVEAEDGAPRADTFWALRLKRSPRRKAAQLGPLRYGLRLLLNRSKPDSNSP
jgi:hypothetical protein